MNTAPQKFSFTTVFDGDGDVPVNAPIRKTFFTLAEVDAERAAAFAEGSRAALSQAQQEEARCLESIRQAIAQSLGSLAQVAHDHREAVTDLALAAARKIADAALEQFPQAAATAAFESLLREVESYPRLLVRAPEAQVGRMQIALEAAAQNAGFAGQVTVKADPQLNGGAFIFEWGEGRAAFDPEQAAARIADALKSALAAEGVHGEPLIAAQGTTDV